MKAALVAVLSLSLFLSGCVSTHSVTPASSGNFTRAELRPGDRAEVLLQSGKTRVMRVDAIDGQTLTGREKQGGESVSVQISLADVQSIEVRRGSILRSAGLVIGVAAGLFVVLVGAVLISCSQGNNKCSD
jgi:hypothetical protein